MKELHISDVSVSNLFGKCDFCKHQKYIGIYGKPCVVPEPCLYETGKKNWEHNGKFPDVSDSSNFTKEEALLHLQKKLFGLPSALQHTIFEAVYRIEHGGYDIQKVLNWYHKIEELYNSKI
jgi:hypothetical protein